MEDGKVWSAELIEACARVQAAMEELRDLDFEVATGNHILPPPVRERTLAILAKTNPGLAAKLRAGDGLPDRFTYRAIATLKERLVRSGALVNLDMYAAWGVDVSKPGGPELLALLQRVEKFVG